MPARPRPEAAARPPVRASLLRLGLPARLALAALPILLVWLAIAWALA